MTTSTSTKSPDFNVYAQTSDNAPLHRVGAAWKHGQGDGINIKLNSLPLDGELVLFPPKEQNDSE